ncbi:MAG: hypothetical protein U9Q83_00150 [Bacteroidota bacterium]|nr:hypothetical protein [Bacteroidota bacterium]
MNFTLFLILFLTIFLTGIIITVIKNGKRSKNIKFLGIILIIISLVGLFFLKTHMSYSDVIELEFPNNLTKTEVNLIIEQSLSEDNLNKLISNAGLTEEINSEEAVKFIQNDINPYAENITYIRIESGYTLKKRALALQKLTIRIEKDIEYRFKYIKNK